MSDKATFYFKKFEVKHDKCAMKIGTDGVLLGAWVDLIEKNKVLDVGVGSGLIALMIAQRANYSQVRGLELDSSAASQAKDNCCKSSYHNQLIIDNVGLKEFQSDEKFDLVVSNPPFFMNSLKTPEEQRTQARHTDTLEPELLFSKSYELLAEDGELAIIFPSQSNELIQEIANDSGFFVKRKCDVYATSHADMPKRTLWQFSKKKCTIERTKLVIEKARHDYTDGYIALTREFYLKM